MRMACCKVLFFIHLLSFIAAAQYRFDSWTTDNGLPQNAVRSIARTSDGYLWIGTYEGLARFDGVEFTSFNLGNTKEMKSNYVRALIEDKKGNLWIGIDGGGLVRYSDKKFYYYSEAEGFKGNIVISLFEDSAGNIWIGSEDGGLSVLRDDHFTNYKSQEGLPSSVVLSFAEDGEGNVWLGTDKGLATFKDGKFQAFNENDRLKNIFIRSLMYGPDKKLWVGTGKGLVLLQNGSLTDFPSQGQFSDQNIASLSEDNDKNLWIGTDLNGLFRLDQKQSPLKAEQTKIIARVLSLYSDSENQIWVGTSLNGLFRYSLKNFTPLADPNFQLEKNTTAVFEDRLGYLWFAITPAVYRLKAGSIQEFAFPEKIPGVITGILQDKDGNMWFAGDGVDKLADGKLARFSTAQGLSNNIFYIMMDDHHGDLWVGTFDGLNLIRDGQIRVFRKEDGLPDNNILALFEDRNGSIWIGTREGLTRYEEGRFTNWTAADGLAGNRISSFYEDQSGSLWIATNAGLTRFKNGKFSVITTRDGLYDNLAHHILEDNAGNLWMSSNRGIYRAALKDLNDFADGIIGSINSYSYGKDDGMLTRDCNGASPGAWKTKDGKLWFSTTKGLVEVNPENLDTKPSNVIIEQALINNAISPDNDALEMHSGQETLEIKYTAIAWKRPSKINFKYRLEGLNQEWVDVGTRRSAYFSYLPPGEYTFQVIADNGEGFWNTEGKSLKIKVLPPFYRAWWFSLLLACFVATMLYLLYRQRISVFRRRQALQEEFSRRLIDAHESERRRIAAELHDSLGQSLAMIKNTAVFSSNTIEDLPAAREQFEQISSQSTQAISEVREIAYNLRPYLLDRLGLTKAIRSMLSKINDTGSIKLNFDIDEIDNIFSNEAEMSVYRILQESINNILKHSDSTEASISIKRSGQKIDMRIEDFGKGFDTDTMKTGEKRGFGLLGMSERVKMLGGTHAIYSVIGQGTVVKIFFSIPATEDVKRDGQPN